MVGYDGSAASARALDVAADLVGYGSTLAVVTVGAGDADHSLAADAREQLQGRLVQAGYHETTGEPATELVQKAHELDADLLVIGRGNGRPALGSVSSKVVSRADCDVLVVR
jgi:nucleotide-binding universal stress UspA family protein